MISDRYEVSESTTARPNKQSDEGGFGFNGGNK